MNDPLPVEQSRPLTARILSGAKGIGTFCLIAGALSGCQGSATSLRQSLGSFGAGFQNLGAPTRVPPPETGSFQTPGQYSTSSSPAGTMMPTGASSKGNTMGQPRFDGATNMGPRNSPSSLGPSGPRTAFNNGPSPLLESISAAESQLLNATNAARNTVNRTADQLNSRVEQASARADRFGQGVVQAGSILAEAAAPIETFSSEFDAPAPPLPASPASASGRIGDADPNAAWRKPSGQ